MLKKAALFLLVLLAVSSLWAQNRYALVIGNAQYSRVDDRLPNAINDTNDISSALRGLGYDVVLKQNLQYLDMVREVETFTNRLRNNRNSEGFFWYAGHAMEVEGESLLLPLNVDLGSDSLTRATSYSVTNLTRQLNAANNKLNVVVLDACRIPPAVGGGARSMGDTSRVIRTVPSVPSDLFVIYSTAPGMTASDGTGSRNSPFAQAFLNNIYSTEPLSLVVNFITRDTMYLTNQRQRPFPTGSIISELYYSLNPSGIRPVTINGDKIIPNEIYKLYIGFYIVPGDAVNTFDTLKHIGYNPIYEQYGDGYHVVLPEVKADEIPKIADILGNFGFKEITAYLTPIATFRQEGLASWYGMEFSGSLTASGEIFNPALFTAGHPSLPFGTILKVTNKQNMRQVTVRINDRGPFVSTRIIDLSMAAAEVLDMIRTETAPVIIEIEQ